MRDRVATIDMDRKMDGDVPLSRREWELDPHLTMSPGVRLTSIPSDIFIHPAVWPQQTWAKNWEAVPLLGEGKLVPHLTQCGLGRGLPPFQASS